MKAPGRPPAALAEQGGWGWEGASRRRQQKQLLAVPAGPKGKVCAHSGPAPFDPLTGRNHCLLHFLGAWNDSLPI